MIIIEAKFERIKPLETKTNLVFSTKDELNEITVAQMLRADGYLLFSMDEIKQEVERAVKEKKIGLNEKGFSPSQRLRAVMSLIWQNDPYINLEKSFDEFYIREMEKIIEHYKKKING